MMSPKHFRLLFSLLFWYMAYSVSLPAQIEDLTQDKTFFDQQKKVYQLWLDHAGLGKFLQVRELEVKENEVILYLEFPYHNIDSIFQAWYFLKQEFEANSAITIEQQLFYKMVSLMEVRQSVAKVALFDTYDLRKEPLFLRGIYFEDGKVVVVENNPRSKIREISFPPLQLGEKMKKSAKEQFGQNATKTAVFELIYEFVKGHYKRKTCESRYPEVRLLENEEVLRFEAIDLCRVVLTDAANPLLAKVLHVIGLDYNWVKREKLDVTIAYKELEEGFSLQISIDGKYGSGLYDEVGRGGYYNMEIDFDEYLEKYADRFKECLRCKLLYGKEDCCD